LREDKAGSDAVARRESVINCPMGMIVNGLAVELADASVKAVELRSIGQPRAAVPT
jgi:hypothetical protein